MRRCVLVLMIVSAALAGSACSDVEIEKQKRLAAGNAYFESGKYPEAILEYRRAIQADGRFGEARYRLARAYERIGEVANAYREMVRAADLLDDTEVQLSAGNYRLMAGEYDEAKAIAEKVLARDRRSVQAQILRGNALIGLKDIEGAVREMEEAVRLDPNRGSSYSSLGSARMLQGQRAEAEADFKRAVASEPKSVQAILALANFYLAESRFPEAEQSLKQALSIDPQNLMANRALAAYYLSANRAPEAEPLLKTVAEVSPTADADFQLADVYVATGREKDARAVLEGLLRDKGAAAEARLRLAALDYAAGNRALAHAGVDEVLKAAPKHVQGLILKGEFLMSEGKPSDALTRFQTAASADAASVSAYYGLGRALAATGHTEEAGTALNEALKLNPRAATAQIALSKLKLAGGDRSAAVDFAEDAVESAPRMALARTALVRSLLANGNVDRAQAELEPLLQRFPQQAEVRELAGRVRLARKDLQGAEREFRTASELDPNSLSALEGLIYVDLARGKVTSGVGRVEERLERSPANPELLLLSARTYLFARDPAKAEAALRQIIAVDSSRPEPYQMLSRLYMQTGKLAEAQRELELLAQKMPKSVGVHTALAYVLDARNLRADARARYEQVLQLDPRAPVASNNLAWSYAEEGTRLDMALQLAQSAKAQLGDSPDVNDTLGWVYYKKGLMPLAVSTLEVSVAQQPSNAVFRYHLGMAQAKAGQTAAARRQLEAALALRADFPGNAEAKATLSSLGR